MAINDHDGMSFSKKSGLSKKIETLQFSENGSQTKFKPFQQSGGGIKYTGQKEVTVNGDKTPTSKGERNGGDDSSYCAMLLESIPNLEGKTPKESQIIPAPIQDMTIVEKSGIDKKKIDSGSRLEPVGCKLIDFANISIDEKRFKSVQRPIQFEQVKRILRMKTGSEKPRENPDHNQSAKLANQSARTKEATFLRSGTTSLGNNKRKSKPSGVLFENGLFQFGKLPFDEKKKRKSRTKDKVKAAKLKNQLEKRGEKEPPQRQSQLVVAFNMATQTATRASFPSEESEERSMEAYTLVPTPEIFRKPEVLNGDYTSRNSQISVVKQAVSTSAVLRKEKKSSPFVADPKAERAKKKEITNILKNLRAKSSHRSEKAAFWNKYLVNDYVIRNKDGADDGAKKAQSFRVDEQQPIEKLFSQDRSDYKTARGSYRDFLEQNQKSKSSQEGVGKDQSQESGTSNERLQITNFVSYNDDQTHSNRSLDSQNPYAPIENLGDGIYKKKRKSIQRQSNPDRSSRGSRLTVVSRKQGSKKQSVDTSGEYRLHNAQNSLMNISMKEISPRVINESDGADVAVQTPFDSHINGFSQSILTSSRQNKLKSERLSIKQIMKRQQNKTSVTSQARISSITPGPRGVSLLSRKSKYPVKPVRQSYSTMKEAKSSLPEIPHSKSSLVKLKPLSSTNEREKQNKVLAGLKKKMLQAQLMIKGVLPERRNEVMIVRENKMVTSGIDPSATLVNLAVNNSSNPQMIEISQMQLNKFQRQQVTYKGRQSLAKDQLTQQSHMSSTSRQQTPKFISAKNKDGTLRCEQTNSSMHSTDAFGRRTSIQSNKVLPKKRVIQSIRTKVTKKKETKIPIGAVLYQMDEESPQFTEPSVPVSQKYASFTTPDGQKSIDRNSSPDLTVHNVSFLKGNLHNKTYSSASKDLHNVLNTDIMNTIKVSVNEMTMMKEDMMRRQQNSARFMNESVATESARNSVDEGKATLSDGSRSRSASLVLLDPISMRAQVTNQQTEVSEVVMPFLQSDYIDNINKTRKLVVQKQTGLAYTRLRRPSEKPKESVSKVDTGLLGSALKRQTLEFQLPETINRQSQREKEQSRTMRISHQALALKKGSTLTPQSKEQSKNMSSKLDLMNDPLRESSDTGLDDPSHDIMNMILMNNNKSLLPQVNSSMISVNEDGGFQIETNSRGSPIPQKQAQWSQLHTHSVQFNSTKHSKQ